jgi:hypothetical protein
MASNQPDTTTPSTTPRRVFDPGTQPITPAYTPLTPWSDPTQAPPVTAPKAGGRS